MEQIVYTTASEAETIALGERIAQALEPRIGMLIGLSGPLGAGKTRVVKGMLYGFGLARSVTVQSPTYIFYKRYEGGVPLFHFDFYRLTKADDLLGIDFWEAAREGIVLIEWFDRFKAVMPTLDCEMTLAYGGGPEERVIKVEGAVAFVQKLRRMTERGITGVGRHQKGE